MKQALLADYLAASFSLYEATGKGTKVWNVSPDGHIGVMQDISKCALEFCEWADENVDFDASMLDKAWPYLLEVEFGRAMMPLLELWKENWREAFVEAASKLGAVIK